MSDDDDQQQQQQQQQRSPQRFRVDGIDFENAEAVKAYLLSDDDEQQQDTADPAEVEAILNGTLDLCSSVEQGPLGSVSEWRYLMRDAARNLRDRIEAHQARAQRPPCAGEDPGHAHA